MMCFMSHCLRNGEHLLLGLKRANVDAELAIEEKKKDVVERILRWKRTGRNRPHAYLVLWKDYPPEEATWESVNQFDQEDLKQLLARDAPPEELSNERGRSF